ncbi:hypothetical protein DFH08DRAFT_819671 [Mycena albidolilacea]|uniref:Uncharacterized protein n=1 Tax=Mycena albidolilacea TaxID=1033008 RepID=A0AAD7EGD4_9AGAR|nr:hypothetical protein DFH08DRAFT_819671 [Mycena albidolilacea]
MRESTRSTELAAEPLRTAQEAHEMRVKATSANRALLEHKVKTDLPAQYKMLSPGGPKGDEIAEPADTENGLSDSDSPSQLRDHSPEPDQKAEKGEQKHELSVIQVNFLDQTNYSIAHHQVFVDEFPVAVSTVVNSTKKYTTLLSDLFPAAIENDLPIKGKINALLAKSSHALLARLMNKYNLLSIPNVSQSPEVTDLEGTQVTTFPLQFTGTGLDVPLDIVNSCAQFNPMHEHTLPGLCADFVKAAVPNMPDQGQYWGRCKFAGESLNRYLLQQATFDFAGWGRTAGGFIVPRGHDKFSGVSFKKELIFEVLNIKSSSTSEIKLFAPEGLEKAPKVKAWVNTVGDSPTQQF